MRYKRDFEDKLLSLTGYFPAVVLTGARQTGKTSLLRYLFPTYTYVSLDLPSDAQLAEEDPDHFFQRYPPPIIIDEVQYAPKLFRHLKILIDKDRKRNGRFLLTGSQKFNLMKEVSDSLAGRCALVELETLSTNELGQDHFRYIEERGLASFLARGTFPQLWDDKGMPRDDFLRSYIATYIERDVRQILNIGSLRDFDRFMRVCAVRTGQLVNKSEIAKEVGVSSKTVNDWLSVLQACNQILLLEPYFRNMGKRVVKSPKLYFADSGIATFLLGLNESNLLSSPHLGHIWETFVYSELRKYVALTHPEASIWFYRDQQKEADFLISYGSKLFLADAKWSEFPDQSIFRSLKEIQAFFPDASERLTIFHAGQTTYPLAKNLNAWSGFKLFEWVNHI